MLKRLVQHFRSRASDGLANGQAHNGRTNGTSTPLPQATTALTHDSYTERASAWASQAHLCKDEQLREWERRMEENFLGPIKTDPAKTDQLAFLKRLLRQQNQPFESVAVSAKALYDIFMVDGQGRLEYFIERITERNTPEEISRHLPLIETLARIYGSESAQRVLPLLSPLIVATEDLSSAALLGTDLHTGHEVRISQKARQQGLYVIGSTGTGKTTLLLNLIVQDITQGFGVCLIEPHGDLVKAVIAGIPEARLKDVVYLDLADERNPYGLNLFECENPSDLQEAAKVASFVMHVFEKVWQVGTETPRLQQVLRNITRTLIENPGMTFAEIPLLLWNDAVREKLLSRVTNNQTRLFFEAYNRKSVRDREELIASTMNKVDAYLNEPLVANIVSQSGTTINFRTIMDESKILLVNLSPLLEEASRLIGALLVGRLLMTAYARNETPESERVPFMLFCDEFQRYATHDFSTLCTESRKFNLNITLANQVLDMLDEASQAAALQSGSLGVFRCTAGADPKILAGSFDATPKPVVVGLEPQRAVAADPMSSLVTRGHQDARVAAFSQRYLAALEHYLKTPSSPSVAYVKTWDASHDCFDGRLSLYDHQVQEGRKLLNECLYRCQSETNPHLYIPMLATYVLALSQRDGREYVFSPHVQAYNHGILFGPFSLKGFAESARKFGEAGFVEPKGAARYIASVATNRKREKWMAEAVVSMLTELRYVMTVLSQSPIMVDTGQMVPKYQLRTYSDQQNQNANEISQLENYHAKVKTLGGEYLLKTNPPPPLLPEHEVEARIQAIKANNKAEGYTRDVSEVLEEIAKRQERLRQRPNDAPPPSHSTGRPIRRRRPPGQS